MNIAQFLVLILAVAFIGGYIAQKIKLPLMVGYLGSGVAVSWFLNKWIASGPTVNSIADIGVALLMFSLGLEFSLGRLKNLGEIILVGSFLQIFTTVIFGIVLFQFLGFDFYNSLFLGSVLSLSSTAAVVKILSDRGELDTLGGEIAVGWLLAQDVATLLFIVLLPVVGLSMFSGSGWLYTFLTVIKSISVAGLSLGAVFFLGRKIVPIALDRISLLGVRELLLVAVVTICLFFAAIAQNLGFPFALGAFLAGVIIAPTSGRHAIFSEIRPLRDVFSTIFFVSLGFLVLPEFVWQNYTLIILVTILFIVFKFIISDLLVILLGFHTKTAFSVGISMISVGEFAFILSQLGRDQNLITDKSYMMILSVTILSLILSTPLMGGANSIYIKLKSLLKEKIPLTVPIFNRLDKQIVNHDNIFSNHAVILGHGRVGKYISKALYSSGVPFIVVDYNNHLVKNLRTLGIEVIYGDPAEIDVLKAANITQAKVVVIAIADRHTQDMVIANTLSLNSAIKIICRSHFEEDGGRLKSLGVEEVIQPEFEAAVSITGKLLKIFNLEQPMIESQLFKLKIDHGF